MVTSLGGCGKLPGLNVDIGARPRRLWEKRALGGLLLTPGGFLFLATVPRFIRAIFLSLLVVASGGRVTTSLEILCAINNRVGLSIRRQYFGRGPYVYCRHPSSTRGPVSQKCHWQAQRDVKRNDATALYTADSWAFLTFQRFPGTCLQ
eukprot:scaffold747_cov120-Cylindrotheca_fusiformis.AAC.6